MIKIIQKKNKNCAQRNGNSEDYIAFQCFCVDNNLKNLIGKKNTKTCEQVSHHYHLKFVLLCRENAKKKYFIEDKNCGHINLMHNIATKCHVHDFLNLNSLILLTIVFNFKSNQVVKKLNCDSCSFFSYLWS